MSLSSLIVQREVATMRQVEEALARQVIYGGDLVTNLLEVARVDEAVLTELLAESMRLPAAPPGELPNPPEAVRSLVPPEIAVERTVVPLEIDASGKLVLAVAEALPLDVQEQLRFALGMTIDQRAAPAVRVQQAVSRAYGMPLERRMVRLIARLAGGVPGAGSTPPVLGSSPRGPEPPRPPSAPPVVVGRLVSKGTNRFKTASGFPAVFATTAPASAKSEASKAPPVAAAESRGGLLQRDVGSNAPAARRRRGPLTVEAARQAADEAGDRDALLDLFFEFSRQFFDYAALFLVHGDIAEGRDAFGHGATRERVLGIGVPLDMPSMLSTAREKRQPLVAKAPSDGLDSVLLADLHRAADAEMALVPLVVRTRAVAILIGDCGELGVDRGSVQQVTSFAGVVGRAFERIIVRRKLEGFIAGGSERVGRVSRQMAAARDLPAKEAPAPLAAAPPAPAPAPAPAPPPAPERMLSFTPEPMLAFTASPSPPPISTRTRPLAPPVPPLSKRTGRAAASPSSGNPPPAANVAAVRQISGPPIPREEPGISGVAPDASDAQGAGASAPQVEVLHHLEVGEVDDAEGARALFDQLGWDGSEVVEDQPPASAAIAVPAHLPPSRMARASSLPSVMVADFDRECLAMVDRLASGEPDEHAEGELLRQGERAMRVIMSRFPGPLTFPRNRIATTPNPPRPSECGPILRLIARQRRVALPFVLDRLAAADPETRGWATYLLCELAYVEALPGLLPRLRDPDANARASAGYALAAIAKAHREAVREALTTLARAADAEGRLAALSGISRLQEATLVPELIRALGDSDDRVVAAARDGLVQVTRHDLGTDARPWMRWWDQNSGRHRIEWLIDALTREVAELRRSAGEELRALTKEYFGYSADLPPRDRDRAQQRYRDWWVMEGRARFRKS
jgi:type II secretion system (T2SS) protein E